MAPTRLRSISPGSAVSAGEGQPQRSKKAELGQFFTPPDIAAFMAGLFPAASLGQVRLLDAGAGVGALTTSFLRRVQAGDFGAPSVSAVAYEVDRGLLGELQKNLSVFEAASVEVRASDFISASVLKLRAGQSESFTHAILNPPYRKMSSRSLERVALRSVGIEAVNLYSAFVGLALLSMKKGGLLCAIIPRSFCNGPYYRPFRKLVLAEAALRKIHVFNARDKAFAEDAVLQENVVVMLERGAKQGVVQISSSTDHSFSDFWTRRVSFERVVRPGDTEQMIWIPTEDGHDALGSLFSASLGDLGITVSTGPVVDFRLKEHLRKSPSSATAPLLYPSHFSETGCRWPYGSPKKPSAIVDNEDTRKWLYPAGNYTVVRRLSSKEERRRIVARTITRDQIPTDRVGFENHLNVFHSQRAGLGKHVAFGLMTYLNSSMLDAHFRAFNGHTQVNATDLRVLPYPDERALVRMGKWAAAKRGVLSQETIDGYLASLGFDVRCFNVK